MRMTWIQSSVLAVTIALLAPVVVLAQKDEKDKVKKDVQQIIITRSGEKDEKVVVEISGDKVPVLQGVVPGISMRMIMYAFLILMQTGQCWV